MKSKKEIHQVDEINREVNAINLYQEFNNQTIHFMNMNEIEGYLS